MKTHVKGEVEFICVFRFFRENKKGSHYLRLNPLSTI